MTECSNNPVELVLATTDPTLYNAAENSWTWDGQMYWTVECLSPKQTSVSDTVLPRIPPEQYITLDTTPATWNYCKSKKCSPRSTSMHIIFKVYC